MPTRDTILESLQFDFVYDSRAMNQTGSSPYQITYQFASSQPGDLWDSYSGWQGLTNGEEAAVRDALDYIESVLNVDFVEVTGSNDPDMNFGSADLDSIGANVAGIGGPSIWLTGERAPYAVTGWDGYALWDTTEDLTAQNSNLILHEIAHAMGLDHSFEGTRLASEFENNHYTIMSYTADPHSMYDPDAWGFNDGFMLFDLLALQDIWGAAASNEGDTVYSGPRNGNVDVIWDTGGTDSLDASARANAVSLDLGMGRFSSFGGYEDVAIGYNTSIENAAGGAAGDTLTGNDLRNRIAGNDGDDAIAGQRGNDVLNGDGGNDTINGNQGRDLLIGGTGDDTLNGGIHDDRLRGEDGHDTLIGSWGSDRLVGGEGNDVLTGDEGRDVLYGGAGDDSLDGGALGDRLYGGEGNDTLVGGAGWDRLDGGVGDDNLSGGAGRDVLFGAAGADTLNGGGLSDLLFGGADEDILDGGFGNDRLAGGTGNDLLTGGEGEDAFFFRATFGTDTVLDFTDNVDTLVFSQLGDMTTVLEAARESEGDVIFDFGGGDTLVVENTTLQALLDDIAIA